MHKSERMVPSEPAYKPSRETGISNRRHLSDWRISSIDLKALFFPPLWMFLFYMTLWIQAIFNFSQSSLKSSYRGYCSFSHLPAVCKERGLEKGDRCFHKQRHEKLLIWNKSCLFQKCLFYLICFFVFFFYLPYLFLKDVAGLYFI